MSPDVSAADDLRFVRFHTPAGGGPLAQVRIGTHIEMDMNRYEIVRRLRNLRDQGCAAAPTQAVLNSWPEPPTPEEQRHFTQLLATGKRA